MGTLEIVILVVAFLIGLVIYVKAFHIFRIVEGICGIVVLPIDLAGHLIASRESFLPGGQILRLITMVGVFIASVAYIVISVIGGTDFGALIEGFIQKSTLFGFTELLNQDLSLKDRFTYAAFVSLGLSSFISVLYMRCTVESLDEWSLPLPVNILLLILFNMAFAFVSTLWAEPLTLWCNSAADYIVGVYHQLAAVFNAGADSIWQFLKIIPIGLFLLILLYAALAAFVITFREILATVMYGMFALVLFFVGGFLTMVWPACPEWIMVIFLLISLLLPDYIRANEDAKEAFADFIEGLG